MKVIGLAVVVACFFANGCDGCGHESGEGPDAACLDEDGDGVTACAGDCDDADPFTFPGAPEVCGDAKDNTCGGQPDAGCGGIGTFVAGDPAKGSDTNPGTQASPVATIAKGMANAQMLAASTGNAQSVFVAQGHYPEAITLVEKISLRGGYDCTAATCTWSRNPIAFDTAILNQTYEGIVADTTITKATVVDGFRIVGASVGSTPVGANGTNCMTLNSGSPKVTNNIFQPAAISGQAQFQNRSIGIRIVSPTTDPTGALIDANLFTGAMSQELSTGIVFTGPGQAGIATITNNVFNGGTAAQSRGISGFGSGPATLIARNLMTCGTSTAGGDSWAIQLGTAATIDSNQINIDQNAVGTCAGSNWCGGIDAGGANVTITNNVVYGVKGPRSTAVRLRDFEQALGTVVLNSNYLDGAGSGLSTGTQSQSSALVLGVFGGVNVFVGKVRNNIMMGGINNLRTGVFEDPNQTNAARTVHTEAFENNDIFFLPARASGDALYRAMSAGQPGTQTLYTTVATMEAGITIKNNGVATGDLNADPLFDATFHIAATSPCVNAGVATEAPATDFEANARPSGAAFDIGNDETP
ncbi:MAG TPA: putative metal-binding motif-containing protein [Kofleriaceae bacterium]|nr:putative metal-binding motif-containing protein [Kofleriaceae bacterium]